MVEWLVGPLHELAVDPTLAGEGKGEKLPGGAGDFWWTYRERRKREERERERLKDSWDKEHWAHIKVCKEWRKRKREREE